MKRTIESLSGQGVIEIPQIEDIPTATKPTRVYVFTGERGRRDSIVVVAQLSPQFTARLVGRWQALESGATALPKTLPEALRLVADLADQKTNAEEAPQWPHRRLRRTSGFPTPKDLCVSATLPVRSRCNRAS
ncbi:hypothetical protein NBN09_39140 (plasmid) [Burkholderia lata]